MTEDWKWEEQLRYQAPDKPAKKYTGNLRDVVKGSLGDIEEYYNHIHSEAMKMMGLKEWGYWKIQMDGAEKKIQEFFRELQDELLTEWEKQAKNRLARQK